LGLAQPGSKERREIKSRLAHEWRNWSGTKPRLEISGLFKQDQLPMIPTGLRRKYNAHLSSARWRNMRRDVIRRRGAQCERCGKAAGRLCLHHKTYKRFGREAPTDLELLCCACHKPADRARKRVRVSRCGMSQSAVVIDFQKHKLHALKREGSEFVWFVLLDVCRVLQIAPENAARGVKEKQRDLYNLQDTSGRTQQMTIVREDGVYRLACTSRNPIAQQFADWLYCEVLPEIRRTGGYEGGAAPLDALIGDMQFTLNLGDMPAQKPADNVLSPAPAELQQKEIEFQRQALGEFRAVETTNNIPRGLVPLSEKQRQQYEELFSPKREHNREAPQVCYGPGGILVERWDV
jgi:prophage antirepressor-like protein